MYEWWGSGEIVRVCELKDVMRGYDEGVRWYAFERVRWEGTMWRRVRAGSGWRWGYWKFGTYWWWCKVGDGWVPVKLFSNAFPRNFLSRKEMEVFICSTNTGKSTLTPCILLAQGGCYTIKPKSTSSSIMLQEINWWHHPREKNW